MMRYSSRDLVLHVLLKVPPLLRAALSMLLQTPRVPRLHWTLQLPLDEPHIRHHGRLAPSLGCVEADLLYRRHI
jgi:hypothetical protein